MVSVIISRLVILVFGTLYPAYASYKAVRTKNVKEYVKWMMYWIVFALFSCVETFSDVFLSWLPFYYEVKIVFVLWMLSPMTKGSSFLFKKFVHPQLAKREKDIDELIVQASKQGYSTLLTLGTRGLQFASKTIMQATLRGHGKLVDHIRRSYSTSDLTDDGHSLAQRHVFEEDDDDDELDNRLREDQQELVTQGRLTRSKDSIDISNKHSRLKKSQSAAAALSSVKEVEEEEEEEVTVTEEIMLYPNTRKQYTAKEDSNFGSSMVSSGSRYSNYSYSSGGSGYGSNSSLPDKLTSSYGISANLYDKNSPSYGSTSSLPERNPYDSFLYDNPSNMYRSTSSLYERTRSYGGSAGLYDKKDRLYGSGTVLYDRTKGTTGTIPRYRARSNSWTPSVGYPNYSWKC
ncbi:receptor expression-enhancing protein 2-like isoform X2 [Haliotis cracherodii]|uniref:receptor expression-enhancing protein 2-like isoform X2 n=1 Tax=Haliotis cracherodii TaxID=6455 RepID=UPI0039E7D7AD